MSTRCRQGSSPLQFGPSSSSGLNYSSIIVEVTPDEFQKIRNEQLTLPRGWRIGELIPKAAGVECG